MREIVNFNYRIHQYAAQLPLLPLRGKFQKLHCISVHNCVTLGVAAIKISRAQLHVIKAGPRLQIAFGSLRLLICIQRWRSLFLHRGGATWLQWRLVFVIESKTERLMSWLAGALQWGKGSEIEASISRRQSRLHLSYWPPTPGSRWEDKTDHGERLNVSR